MRSSVFIAGLSVIVLTCVAILVGSILIFDTKHNEFPEYHSVLERCSKESEISPEVSQMLKVIEFWQATKHALDMESNVTENSDIAQARELVSQLENTLKPLFLQFFVNFTIVSGLYDNSTEFEETGYYKTIQSDFNFLSREIGIFIDLFGKMTCVQNVTSQNNFSQAIAFFTVLQNSTFFETQIQKKIEERYNFSIFHLFFRLDLVNNCVLFTLVTVVIIVHLLIWKLRRNVQYWLQFSLILCLWIFTSIRIYFFSFYFPYLLKSPPLYVLADKLDNILHFWLKLALLGSWLDLAIHGWVTAISFNFWYTFKRSTLKPAASRDHKRIFIYYSTVTLLFASIVSVAMVVPFPPNSLVTIVASVTMIFVLASFNLFFFVSTFRAMRATRQSTGSSTTINRQER
ncbi:uncharacterized protein LOC118434071 isoform X1 [Folsomia candida]|uniref:uncharacterized protein LOC118434071 isoform X1 n=1 Tax=Folsomia candida TaxID=158441 RepID=UPI0016055D14|nr:uncharacterized protein LOC118434071 isoform X1 [Folsomia candida]